MSARASRQFVDTNILVYAYDRTQEEKWERARGLVDSLWLSGEGTLSIQVLQEFFHTVTRKLPHALTVREARTIVRDLSRWTLHRPDRDDLFTAIDLHEESEISFWDAMIVQSARRMNCAVLWTEDLSDGQSYAGVTARNPFLEVVMEGEPYGASSR
jgi:predicted nucleic acid-binding protein